MHTCTHIEGSSTEFTNQSFEYTKRFGSSLLPSSVVCHTTEEGSSELPKRLVYSKLWLVNSVELPSMKMHTHLQCCACMLQFNVVWYTVRLGVASLEL